MRILSVVLGFSVLSGCTNIPALNPVPSVPSGGAPPIEFSSLSDAKTKLGALSVGYSSLANGSQLDLAMFDIFVVGLPFAAAANGIFGGAKDTTLALGLASIGASGAKAYFGPQVKVAAYNNAASSFSCASALALELDKLQSRRDISPWNPDGGVQMAALLKDLGIAYQAVSNNFADFNTMTDAQRKAFIDARDAAIKANTDITTAFAVLANAPTDLSTFAGKVVQATNDKIRTGVQNNTDAWIKQINGAVPSSSSPPTPAPATPPKKNNGQESAEAKSSIDALTLRLQTEAGQAEAAAKVINDKRATSSSCELAKS